MFLVEIQAAELRKFREAREVMDLETPLGQGEQLPLPQLTQYAIDVDGGEAERVRQIVLGEGTLVPLVRRQTDDLKAFSKFDQKMGNPFQRIPSTEVDQVLDNDRLLT